MLLPILCTVRQSPVGAEASPPRPILYDKPHSARPSFNNVVPPLGAVQSGGRITLGKEPSSITTNPPA
jgi:hypothetical protein